MKDKSLAGWGYPSGSAKVAEAGGDGEGSGAGGPGVVLHFWDISGR